MKEDDLKGELVKGGHSSFIFPNLMLYKK